MSDESNDLEARTVEVQPQPAVAVRMQQAMSELDLGQLFDTHLPNVARRIADLGGEPAGPPYGRYHEWGPERVDVEIGMPVVAPVGNLRPVVECTPGEVGASELPGGRAAVAVHRGSYDRLSATYDGLRDWIHSQGLDAGAGPWESYVDNPSEVSEADLHTEVVWPIRS